MSFRMSRFAGMFVAVLVLMAAAGCGNDAGTVIAGDGDTETAADGDMADETVPADGDAPDADEVADSDPDDEAADTAEADPEPDSDEMTEQEPEADGDNESEAEAEAEAETEVEAETTCAGPADCLDAFWDILCVGHWSCEAGNCVAVCDDSGCGDGSCDASGGESATSCPPDCGQTTCAGENQSPEGIECCEHLTGVDPCRPGDDACGAGDLCVSCGNDRCDPYEHIYNCAGDCAVCTPGQQIAYTCDTAWSFTWCECREAACKPQCRYADTDSEGWYDSCTDVLIEYALCSTSDLVCDYIGGRSEGWYAYPHGALQGSLVTYHYGCAAIMECLADPAAQCPVCGDNVCESDKNETSASCPGDCAP